jgi:hypothetical protein
VIHARKLLPRRRLRISETEPADDLLEPPGVGTRNEEIQVVLSAGRRRD